MPLNLRNLGVLVPEADLAGSKPFMLSEININFDDVYGRWCKFYSLPQQHKICVYVAGYLDY